MSPENARYQRNVAGGKLNEAKILRELNEIDTALALELDALAIHQSIAEKDATNVEIKLDLKEVYEDLAGTYLRLGKTAEAFKNYNKSIEYGEAMLKKDPNNYEFWLGRLLSYKQFGDQLSEAGEVKSARQLYKDAIARAETDTPKQFEELIQKTKKEMQEKLMQ